MEQPDIRYLRANDGTTIAYYAIGAGVPFVWMDMPYSHLQVEWRQDRQASVLRSIARQARLVRYDHRGFGLSERAPGEFTLEALVGDLEAVVDRLDLATCTLFASRGPTTPIAVTYAARHPERVSSLVLHNASARAPSIMLERLKDLLKAAGRDWRFVSESVSRLVQGWDDAAASSALAELLRASTDMDGFERWLDEYARWDVTALVPHVHARTLLMNQLGHSWFGEAHGRAMAADMPDARCFINDGATSDERDANSLAAVADFLGASLDPFQPQPPDVSDGAAPATALVFFADIADSTALTERMGDAAFRQRARALDTAMRAIIIGAGGTTIDAKTLGDGVLATFASASQAIDAALRCGAAGEAQGLPLHLGLHAGDVIREQDNVFGGAVNIAARISGLSTPGELLVSDTVRSLARTSAGVTFEDRGEHALKGVSDPQRVYVVRRDGG